MKAAIVIGGTGGHIYPAISIAEALQDRDLNSRILFIGSEEGLEKTLIAKERFALETIKSRGLLRKLSYKAFSAPFVSIIGFFQALKILRLFKPDILITTGGFVSIPCVLAAKYLKIPVLIHELNAIPGLANKISRFFANKITVSFSESSRYFSKNKIIITGTPVRRKILKAIREVSRTKLGLDLKKKTILIFGGSQGARKINEVLLSAAPELISKDYQLIHAIGERDMNELNVKAITSPNYKPFSYLYNVWDGLAAADLVISRSGASAIGEILAKGLPSILIPFPYAAENHQELNARILKKAGACEIIKNQELSIKRLLSIIYGLFENDEKLAMMAAAAKTLSSGSAKEKIVDVVFDMIEQKPVIPKKKIKKNEKSR